MKRRDLFKAIAGLAGVAIVGKEVATAVPANVPNGGHVWSTNLEGTHVQYLGVLRTPLTTIASGGTKETLVYANGRMYTASGATFTKVTTADSGNVYQHFRDLKRGNPRDQMWAKA